MRPMHSSVLVTATVLAGVATFFTAAPAARQGSQAPAPAAPTIQLGPGLREVPNYIGLAAEPPAVTVPTGFTPIFNGKDLSGWHISQTARHGITPDFHVAHGVILGSQRPWGNGGLLVTDRKYRNFELTLEVKPDWGCDSGIFLRTTDTGVAYQVTMDYLPGGSMGRVIAEGGNTVGPNSLPGAGATAGRATGAAPGTPAAPAPAAALQTVQQTIAARAQSTDPGMKAWKHEDWNTVRVRSEGVIPHVMVWINDQLIADFTDVRNNAFGAMEEGPIAVQVHGGPVRWTPGGVWRWRNIGLRELR